MFAKEKGEMWGQLILADTPDATYSKVFNHDLLSNILVLQP